MKYLRIRLELLARKEGENEKEELLNVAIGEVALKGDKNELQDAIQRMASNGLEILLNEKA